MGIASDVIRQRLKAYSLPSGRELGDLELRDHASSCTCALAGKGWRMTCEFDGADSTTEELATWVRLNVADMTEVYVVWLSYHFGVVASLSTILDRLAEIWQPGSDDLWIQGATDAVLLDHEEQVRVFKKSST